VSCCSLKDGVHDAYCASDDEHSIYRCLKCAAPTPQFEMKLGRCRACYRKVHGSLVSLSLLNGWRSFVDPWSSAYFEASVGLIERRALTLGAAVPDRFRDLLLESLVALLPSLPASLGGVMATLFDATYRQVWRPDELVDPEAIAMGVARLFWSASALNLSLADAIERLYS